MSGLEFKRLHRMVNVGLALAIALFGTFVFLILNDLFYVKRASFEARFFPVMEDWTFRNWKQDPTTGFWSAEVWADKVRPECKFLPGQIQTVIALRPDGDSLEAFVRYIGDTTPGSSRPEGWQRLDRRMEFASAEITPETILRGSVLHACRPGMPTTTTFGPVVVGEDTPWPPRVVAWIENGREGVPRDYSQNPMSYWWAKLTAARDSE